ncbi:nuclear transport factor 2 family protein [Hymenobacter sp. BT523]|uniref:nuclear transport factor 2 family protein n=1 Tax=Hymenobacter sp. BT523 TaxID=2795725 RepID=UPI0018EB6EEA|nr:nuclear transport factor 2 family protein [Hymenobacter sp. BT523]MBJ6109589.1 nuclear transport factor 2 family protein [Hymenobacter sp. BT523]
MKQSLVLMLLLFGAGLRSNAQAPMSAEQSKVNQAVTKFFDGLAALDTKTMKQYITTDFLLLEDGAVWNIDTLVNKIKPLKATGYTRVNHLNFFRTDVKGNTAWVAYDNAAEMSAGERKRSRQWLESAVLVKEGKDWKIQLLHSTSSKPKAP